MAKHTEKEELKEFIVVLVSASEHRAWARVHCLGRDVNRELTAVRFEPRK